MVPTLLILVLLPLLLLGWWAAMGRRRNAMPGPMSWPVVGAVPTLARYSKPWLAFSALRKRYGDVFGFRIGSCPCVVVSGLDNIRQVMVIRGQDFAHRPDFARFQAIFRGNRDHSVALCDWSSKHRRRRAVTYPAMNPRAGSMDLERLSSAAAGEVRRLVDKLLEDSGAEGPALYTILVRSMANVFFDFLCGCHFSYDDPAFGHTIDVIQAIFVQLFDRYPIDFFPWLRPLMRKGVLHRLHDLSEKASTFMRPIIDEQRRTLNPHAPRNIIDALLLADTIDDDRDEKSRLSDEDIYFAVEDLIGGFSAVHNVLMWTLLLLAQHKHVQQRLAAEATRAADGKQLLTLNERTHLLLTDATVLEALRLIVSPVIPHRASVDTHITTSSGKEYPVASGSLIFFNTYDMNLDPDLWKDPLTFNPDRFLTEEGRVQKPDFFLPFGVGKRSCLGSCVARNTLVLAVAQLIRHFEVCLSPFSPAPLLRPHEVPSQVLWPQDIHLRLVPRVNGGEANKAS